MTGRPPAAGVRRGLVLGAGGVLGFAWMVGALAALEAEGVDAAEVDVCVGTSAGSVVAALLGCGVGVGTMLRHQQGIPIPGDVDLDWDYDRDSGGALPPRPRLGMGSPSLLRRVVRHPTQVPPLAALSAVLPHGRGTLEPLRRMVQRAARALPAAVDGGPAWPVQPEVWVVAMDYRRGERVAFGRDDAPRATLADAVTASCAIPGWYAPSVIGGRRYVDGGTTSPTSLDLLAGSGLDEAYVLTPMASFAYDRPRSPVARAERRLRRTITRRVLAEAAAVRASGTEVILVGPGPEDLQTMGANLMDPRRRAAVLATSLRTSAAALRAAGCRAERTGTGTEGP